MVEYADGSVLSQMGASDMCTPIAYALAWPDRMHTPGARLDLNTMSDLSFEALDDDKFPAVQLAKNCIDTGLAAGVAMNAANEVAVEAFLNGQIGFLEINDCVAQSLDNLGEYTKTIANYAGLEDIESFDLDIRAKTATFIDTQHLTKTSSHS